MKMVNRFKLTAPEGRVFVRVLMYPVTETDDHAELHLQMLDSVKRDHPRCTVLDMGWELKDDA